MWFDQIRRPRTCAGLGSSYLGQACDSVPFESDRIWRRGDSRAQPNDRSSRAMAAPRGFHILRVRYHKGDLARIEVPLDDLPRFVELEVRGEILPAFRELGFKFVTLDLEGFRSGSLNSVIPAEDLLRGIGRANHAGQHAGDGLIASQKLLFSCSTYESDRESTRASHAPGYLPLWRKAESSTRESRAHGLHSLWREDQTAPRTLAGNNVLEMDSSGFCAPVGAG